MRSFKIKSNVGKDGILRLQLPVNTPEQEVEIIVVMQTIHKQAEKRSEIIGKGLPDYFFQDVVGGWSGDLVRPDQGDFETREEL